VHQRATDSPTPERGRDVEAAQTSGSGVGSVGVSIQATDSYEHTPVTSDEERFAWLGKPVRAGVPFLGQALEETEPFAKTLFQQGPEIDGQLDRFRDCKVRRSHGEICSDRMTGCPDSPQPTPGNQMPTLAPVRRISAMAIPHSVRRIERSAGALRQAAARASASAEFTAKRRCIRRASGYASRERRSAGREKAVIS